MSIEPSLARLLVRECIYKPIQGKVLTLGRQTITMTYKEVMELFHQEGYTPPREALEGMTITHDQRTRVGRGTNYVTDEVFLRLVGVKELLTMDVSAYENADILHDLNKPVPESLHEQFDFIIDGGVFDHLFDIRVAFENVVRMLKPGGRIFQWDAASNFTGAAYISFGPDLFYDYYVLNQFADCKVYVVEIGPGQAKAWDFYEFMGCDTYSNFQSNRQQIVVVLAEKGQSSTWDRMPVQSQYRDAHLWQPYRTAQKAMLSSGRKPFMGSRSGFKLGKRNVPILNVPIPLLIPKLKEKGIVWCLKRASSLLSERVLHLTGERRLRGYIYRGKI